MMNTSEGSIQYAIVHTHFLIFTGGVNGTEDEEAGDEEEDEEGKEEGEVSSSLLISPEEEEDLCGVMT